MSEKAKLKRCENDLYIAGLGVIIFCAWDVAKLLLYALFGNYSIPAMTTQGEQSGQIVGWIVIFALLVVITAINLFIGINAQKAAKGKSHNKGYYVMTFILLILAVLSMATYWDALQDLDNIFQTLASILVDLTSIYVYFMIIRSTWQIRQLSVNA